MLISISGFIWLVTHYNSLCALVIRRIIFSFFLCQINSLPTLMMRFPSPPMYSAIKNGILWMLEIYIEADQQCSFRIARIPNRDAREPQSAIFIFGKKGCSFKEQKWNHRAIIFFKIPGRYKIAMCALFYGNNEQLKSLCFVYLVITFLAKLIQLELRTFALKI